MKVISGNATFVELVAITQFSGCSQSSYSPSKTCDNMIDGDLNTYWVTSTNKPGQWMKLDFTRMHEVHAIDLWSSRTLQGQCSELMFRFSNAVSVKVSHASCQSY